MNLLDAKKAARERMDHFGLTNWRFVFDNAVARAGQCRHRRQQISLSHKRPRLRGLPCSTNQSRRILMGIDARMLVRFKKPISDNDIRRWSYLACSAFGHEPFMVWHPGQPEYCKDWEGRHVFYRVEKYGQDGPDILPEPGETFLQVGLRGRYYGPQYERGDLPFYLSLARWIEDVMGGEVWYGGDSSGVCAEPFDAAAREKLWKHFCKYDTRPYYRDNPLMDPKVFENKPTCPMCAVQMHRYGFGTSYAAYTCPCGWKVVRRDGKEYKGTADMIKNQGYEGHV